MALDGRPLPRFKPDAVVANYVEREIDRHRGIVIATGLAISVVSALVLIPTFLTVIAFVQELVTHGGG